MASENIQNLLNKLQSKKMDCIVFSKKHKDRGNEDLYNYYEGALWAFTVSINLLSESNE